ncbi:hypothetical protein NOR_05731 [Metarhizium rileyi]|uniref:Uncharacterized protein n=1 Tax=Metarhizium rileyi (strain RCEF 4871) TaxID=1649241 RepID=A0A162JDG1_METRR|nr:hypothetical protein NOR_05731 [Metarhizium rileyi RCEF 4871]
MWQAMSYDSIVWPGESWEGDGSLEDQPLPDLNLTEAALDPEPDFVDVLYHYGQRQMSAMPGQVSSPAGQIQAGLPPQAGLARLTDEGPSEKSQYVDPGMLTLGPVVDDRSCDPVTTGFDFAMDELQDSPTTDMETNNSGKSHTISESPPVLPPVPVESAGQDNITQELAMVMARTGRTDFVKHTASPTGIPAAWPKDGVFHPTSSGLNEYTQPLLANGPDPQMMVTGAGPPIDLAAYTNSFFDTHSQAAPVRFSVPPPEVLQQLGDPMYTTPVQNAQHRTMYQAGEFAFNGHTSGQVPTSQPAMIASGPYGIPSQGSTAGAQPVASAFPRHATGFDLQPTSELAPTPHSFAQMSLPVPAMGGATFANQAQNGQPHTRDFQPVPLERNPSADVLLPHDPRLEAPRNGPRTLHSRSPSLEIKHSRETLQVHFEHRPLPPSSFKETVWHGNMCVEKYVPDENTRAYPIILVHGDFHTGQIWTRKPDGGRGWVYFFLARGFTVYVVDMPACGRSQQLYRSVVRWSQFTNDVEYITPGRVEANLTGISKCHPVRWPAARTHSQWPGTGMMGDAIFETYIASTGPLYFRRHQRQSLGKEALTALLNTTGPAFLLGEGSGATASWLAADSLPHLVKAVIAVEPAGPPGGTNRLIYGADWKYGNQVRRVRHQRPYGLTDIPLTFEPPVPQPVYDERGVAQPPLTLVPTLMATPGCVHLLQPDSRKVQGDDNGNLLPRGATTDSPRKLVALSMMPQLIVTGQASHHTTFDQATAGFMKQAGVEVDHFVLDRFGILGNGHLMFLEQNSDVVAGVIFAWMVKEIPQLTPSAAAAEARAANK